jgi:heme-degrading monooxygenase HmoA
LDAEFLISNLQKPRCKYFNHPIQRHTNMIAKTPPPPYFAVIFTSIKTTNLDGYSEMATLMEQLAMEQPGYLGMETASGETGITISYWKDETSILKWKQHTEHLVAQSLGKEKWYQAYTTRVCKVEREYSFAL